MTININFLSICISLQNTVIKLFLDFIFDYFIGLFELVLCELIYTGTCTNVYTLAMSQYQPRLFLCELLYTGTCIYIGNVIIPTQVIKYNKCCSRLISQSACSIHSKNHLTMAKVFLLVERKKNIYTYMCITII